MMRKAVLDRFEEQMAVFILDDTGEPLSCPRNELAPEISEGDHVLLQIEGDQIQAMLPDEGATEDARKRIQEKLERLRRGDHLNKN
jgi:hypothetical protein